VTVAPYMGSDSVQPFLEHENKWVILLALTSNKGAYDFQFKELEGKKLYAEVIEKAKEWGTSEQLMFVVGATRAEEIAEVRKLAPDYFFLVPGVGAQGGSLEEVVKFGANSECGLLVNSSRGIIFAGNDLNFTEAAKKEALKIQSEMALYVQRYEW
jgi:orotidine-5'-phosphate decarboxylase